MQFLSRFRRHGEHTSPRVEPEHHQHPSTAELNVDQRGIPTHECLNCGCNVFIIKATFEDYDISGWFMDAECSCCASPLTAPCPVDHPDYQ